MMVWEPWGGDKTDQREDKRGIKLRTVLTSLYFGRSALASVGLLEECEVEWRAGHDEGETKSVGY